MCRYDFYFLRQKRNYIPISHMFLLLIAYNVVYCNYHLYVDIDKDKPDPIQYISINILLIYKVH